MEVMLTNQPVPINHQIINIVFIKTPKNDPQVFKDITNDYDQLVTY